MSKNKYNRSWEWETDTDDDYYNYRGSGYGYNSRRSYTYYEPIYKEKELFVKEHQSYVTPSDYSCKLKLYSSDIDAVNVDLMQELARMFYYKMMDETDYIDDKYNDLESLTEKEQATYLGKKPFFEQIYNEDIPGYSPIEKAQLVMEILHMTKQDPNPKIDPCNMPDFKDAMSAFQQMIPDREQFESSTLNAIMDSRKDFNTMGKRIRLLQKMAIVGGLGKQFEVKKEIEERDVQNSKINKMKRLNSYEDLSVILPYQMLMPDYNLKLATKNLLVKKPIDCKESKQKIIILLDFSGSMHSDWKQDWVKAILADRLQYAAKEECEIFFSYFIHGLRGEFQHIYNESTAKEFFRTFNDKPNGGDTEVGNCIERIRQEIQNNNNKKFFHLDVDLFNDPPEILVINDGCDDVKTEEFNWKVNAITLGIDNNQLKELCIKSKGKYVTVNTMDKITEFE